MSKETFQEVKARIIKEFGEPLWDMGAPANEAAKRIVAARSKFANDAQQLKNQTFEGKKSIKQAAVDAAVMAGAGIAIPEIDIKETDLEPFNTQERTIISQYFANIRQTHREIAVVTQQPYQKVTALLHSDAFKLLYVKVFDKILPITAYAAVYAQLRLGNDKLAVDVLRDKGLMKNETIEHVARIEDPKAKEKLRLMGYDLVEVVDASKVAPTQILH